jgi:CBS domain-containing protein
MHLVRHVMTEAPRTLGPDRTAADAAGLMAQHDVGAVPLADESGALVGIVTDRDLVLRALAKHGDAAGVRLGDIATKKLVTISPDRNVAEARALMAEHRIRRLPVVKDHRLVGIVALGDVAVAEASKRAVGETLQEISDSDSTRELNDGPDPGTPERVRARRPSVEASEASGRGSG